MLFKYPDNQKSQGLRSDDFGGLSVRNVTNDFTSRKMLSRETLHRKSNG